MTELLTNTEDMTLGTGRAQSGHECVPALAFVPGAYREVDSP